MHKPKEKRGARLRFGSQKPMYNMWQNSAYMIKLAWSIKEKKIVFLCVSAAACTVALAILELFVVPSILSCVETQVPIAELLLTIGLFAVGLMLVYGVKEYITVNTLYSRVQARMELIYRINNKALVTSYCNLTDERFGKLLSKSYTANSSNSAATEVIWETLTGVLASVAGFIIYLCLFTGTQPILILAVVATTVVSYFVSNALSNYRYRHRDEEAEYEEHMYYLCRNASNFSAAKDIRIFGLRSWLNDMYNKALEAYVAFNKRAEGVYIWASIVDLLLTFVRNGAAYAMLIAMVVKGDIGVAEFLLLFTAVGGFTDWVTGILSGLNTLYKQSLDISSMREFLEYPEPFRFEGGVAIPAGAKHELRLVGVSFRYPGAEEYVLKDINLTLASGEKLAVVGLNGAGKTTLIKLMCGFLDPTEGKVLLDGIDIREFNRREYYTLFSAVFQSFSLLAASVAANVAQKEEGIDMERVKDCISRAGLKSKVESLPNGYDTLLNREVYDDAAELSGGELQRMMLARALYRDAPFIMLDEPTAALDPIAEADMYMKYNEMTDGRSSVYISHRLASTRFCDRIILLDGGGIAEVGTHAELLALGGRYAELFEVQSKYYKEGSKDEE